LARRSSRRHVVHDVAFTSQLIGPRFTATISILGRSYAAAPPPYDVTIFGGRRTRSQIKEVEVWHSPDLAMMVEDRPYRTSGQTRQKRTYI